MTEKETLRIVLTEDQQLELAFNCSMGTFMTAIVAAVKELALQRHADMVARGSLPPSHVVWLDTGAAGIGGGIIMFKKGCHTFAEGARKHPMWAGTNIWRMQEDINALACEVEALKEKIRKMEEDAK